MAAGELLEIIGSAALVPLAIWGLDYCERTFTQISEEERLARLQREREQAKPWGDVVESPAAANGGWGAASQSGSRATGGEIAPHHKGDL